MNNEEKILTMLEALTKGQARMETDISDLKTDVATLKTDVATLKTDVASLKIDNANLKTEIANIKKEQIRIDNIIENNLWDTIVQIADMQYTLNEKLESHIYMSS